MPERERVQAFEELVRNPTSDIRMQTLRIGAAILPEEVLVSYLRHGEDAVLRNAGLEILKLRGRRSLGLALSLLRDNDPDVTLQAVLLLDHLKDPRALEPLTRVLHHDDINVRQAAIVAIGHLGDSRAVDALLPFLGGELWLQLAAVEALGDLRSARAVGALEGLLSDLLVGQGTAESLARIGGPDAFAALARQWVRFGSQVPEEPLLDFVAHTLEGLEEAPPAVPGLRERLREELTAGGQAVAAARALLALGEGDEDGAALAVLAAEPSFEPELLPGCLTQRVDLASQLLGLEGRARAWGLLLTARYPQQVAVQDVARALSRIGAEEAPLAAILACATALLDDALDRPLLDLFLALPREQAVSLLPCLEQRGARLLGPIREDPELDETTRTVLLALAGAAVEELLERILALPEAERGVVVEAAADRPEVLRALPWEEWLANRPEVFAGPAVNAARAGLKQVVPLLRGLLPHSPTTHVVRAMGELKDRESVDLLIALLGRDLGLKPLILESLGEIGGAQARGALRRALAEESEDLHRDLYRALSQCATAADEPLFVAAAEHRDWSVRLYAAEVLGRSLRDEYLPVLARLAADPVPVVSKRALAFLEG
jgi:HEAT repeat protein